MLLDKKISGGQRPSKRECSVFRHRVLISKLSCILTLSLSTLPLTGRYKGEYLARIFTSCVGLKTGHYDWFSHSIG